MTFEKRNCLKTHFSECIPIVKRCMTVCVCVCIYIYYYFNILLSSVDTCKDLLNINLLKMKHNLLYIRNQSLPRSKHFPPRL